MKRPTSRAAATAAAAAAAAAAAVTAAPSWSSSWSSSVLVPSVVLATTVLSTLPLSVSSAATSEKLSRYGLSIERLDTIFTSEVNDDFGAPLTSDRSNALFADATRWQWDENMRDELNGLGRSNDFHAYIVCYNETGLSGMQRKEKLAVLFADHEDEYYLGDTIINDFDGRSCYLASALTETFETVIGDAPEEKTRNLEIQPSGPSMKMLKGFYQAIKDRLDGNSTLTAPGGDGQIVVTQDEVLGIDVQFCPVLIEYIKTGKETFKGLVEDIVMFMTQGDGELVKGRDFFYDAVPRLELLPEEPVSDRMVGWHAVIENVTSNTDAAGYNPCIDDMILRDMRVEQSGTGADGVIDAAEITFPMDLNEVTKDDEVCTWYIVRALANHPYVCRMDLRAVPTTMPPPGGDEDQGIGDRSSASHPARLVLGYCNKVVVGIMAALGLTLAAAM